MSEHITYVANGGQTYQPCQDNVKVPFASYEKPAKPNPLLPELELNQDAIDKMQKDIRIVYTPLHGTGNLPARRVLK